MAELSDYPGFDPGTVAMMSGHKIGLLPPEPGSLIAGELYIELNLESGAAKLYVGAPRPTGLPGNLILLLATSGGTPIEPPDTPTAPVNVDKPVILVNGSMASTCAVGDTLACTMGNWQGEPTDYWWSWLSNSNLIGTGNTYIVLAADSGNAILVEVTASNAQGSGNIMTDQISVMPAGA